MYKCTKCGFCTTSEKIAMKHKCDKATLCTRDIHRKGRAGSHENRMQQGSNNLAFMRGYQSGYEDRVMGLQPTYFAEKHRKDIRKRDE